MVVNTSVSVSLYCLILFYTVTEPYLKPFSPITKLLSIKAVVFLAWWQSVGISVLFYYNLIPSLGSRTETEVGSAINSFLICIEMFVLSITNFFVFPYNNYKPKVRRHRKVTETIKEAMKNFATKVVNQKDVLTDVEFAFGPRGEKEALLKHQQPTEFTPLRPVLILDLDEFSEEEDVWVDPFLIYYGTYNHNDSNSNFRNNIVNKNKT